MIFVGMLIFFNRKGRRGLRRGLKKYTLVTLVTPNY